jgi:hypothetical protein
MNEILMAQIAHYKEFETKLAEALTELQAAIDASTPEYEAAFSDQNGVRKSKRAAGRLARRLNVLIEEAAEAHEDFSAVIPTATFPRPRGGGK